MLRRFAGLLIFANLILSAHAAPYFEMLHNKRSAPDDLEITGELDGFFGHAKKYISYENLLSLPQETITVTNDANFPGPTQLTGIPLEYLLNNFGRVPKSEMLAAICSDEYRSHYFREYLTAHHPILVLKINGRLHKDWPKSADGGNLGFYLISNPDFKPSFRVLSHIDEPQIPYAVVRLDIEKQEKLVHAILPPGKWPQDSVEMQGYRIAQQNCLRCHGVNIEEGYRSDRSWFILAAWASSQSRNFKRYIRDPKAVMTGAKMPAQPQYDDATLEALTKYFATFLVLRSN